MDKELLYRFFSDEATVEQQKQVLDWLDADPAHQRELLDERRLFDAMLLHGPLKATRKKLFAIPRWTREVMRYAAIVVLAVVVAGGYVSRQNDKLLEAFNTITVPAGQRVDVVLPDGTKVCMNALSELRYPAFFSGDDRRVKLTGEAFFDVTHDEKHPFVVETYTCNVQVLGTRFDVEARPESDELLVALVEGSVRVSDNANPDNAVILNPNEQASFRNNRFEVQNIPTGESFLWRDGLIAFRDASFAQLLDKFEKYYGVKFQVQRPTLPSTEFTGKIRITEGIDHALWVLQQSADFSYVRNEKKEIIYIQ